MLDSQWLDVAIGVVLIWFLLALSVTLANELLSQALATRSKQLWKALDQLLGGSKPSAGFFKNLANTLFWSWRPVGNETKHPAGDPELSAGDTTYEDAVRRNERSTLAYDLYKTDAIQRLETRPDTNKKTRIANVPTKVFNQAVFEYAFVRQHASSIEEFIRRLPEGAFKRQLTGMWESADKKVEDFRDELDAWFDAQMVRVSGFYKKQVRVILIPIGILIAIAGFAFGLRTDAFALMSDLQHDANYRTLVADAAGRLTKSDLVAIGCPPPTTAPTSTSTATTTTTSTTTPAQQTQCQIAGASKVKNIDVVIHSSTPKGGASFWSRVGFVFQHISTLLGVLITGVAISFGATFWFDIMRRLVGIQSTTKSTG